jgi:hypothetical protein
MNRTLIVVVSCAVVGSIAFAQGKPADKPGDKAPGQAAAAKPGPGASDKAPGQAAPKLGPGASAAKPAATTPAPAAGHVAAADGKPAAAPPASAAPAMPALPKPGPELDAAFKFFEGNWKCESKMPAGSMGPGSPEMTTKSSVKFKKALGGFYYQGEYDLKKTKTTPGFKGVMFIGYQPGAKLFTMTSSDDTGGGEYVTSTGFQGDVITFTGEGYMMGQKVKMRETMSKNGKDAGHKAEADMGKGFQLMGEDTCKR